MSEKRHDLYKVPEVEYFLANAISGESEIVSQFDLEFGYRYPTVEKALGKEPNETKELLEKLAQAGILDRKLHIMDIRCPNCASPNISSSYLCPFCGAINVVRNALIEHISCGYIDVLVNFRKNGNLICPKCHDGLKPGNYRSAGNWYSCESCGKRIESPRPSHACRKCGTKFTLDGASYNRVYSYVLSSAAKEDMNRGVLLIGSIRENLTKLGYEAVTPFVMKGNSGVEHAFDMLLTRGDRRIAMDILTSDKPILQIEVIKEYVKILDAKVDLYLVVIPELSEDARKLAESYKVNVIESHSLQEALKAIVRIFESEKSSLKEEHIIIKEEPEKKEPGKAKLDFFGRLLKRRK